MKPITTLFITIGALIASIIAGAATFFIMTLINGNGEKPNTADFAANFNIEYPVDLADFNTIDASNAVFVKVIEDSVYSITVHTELKNKDKVHVTKKNNVLLITSDIKNGGGATLDVHMPKIEKAVANTAAVINIDHMFGENHTLQATTAACINVDALETTGTLTAKASVGSVITIHGTAEIAKLDSDLGACIDISKAFTANRKIYSESNGGAIR